MTQALIIIQTISLLSNITKNLPITGSSSNDWSSAKAQVDASSTELRILLTEQRQLLQNLDEVLKIKDELEMYMQSVFQNFRKPASQQIMFLLIMERNLCRPPAEHQWAPAFECLLHSIETEALSHVADRLARTRIQVWLEDERLRDKDKTRALLTRCLEIMPTKANRVSSIFAFAKVWTY